MNKELVKKALFGLFEKDPAKHEAWRKSQEAHRAWRYGPEFSKEARDIAPGTNGLGLTRFDLMRERAEEAARDRRTAVEDAIFNYFYALGHGRFPIPFVTLRKKYENSPIDVPRGTPVYIGVSGAENDLFSRSSLGSNSDNYPWLPNSISKWPGKVLEKDKDGDATLGDGSNPKPGTNNTLNFRWFDNAQLVRALNELADDHPIHLIGESYGGSAALNALKNLKKGRKVESITVHDPVAWWSSPKVPTNTVNGQALNIQPKYLNDKKEPWNEAVTTWTSNIVPYLGGRIGHGIEGMSDTDYDGWEFRGMPSGSPAFHGSSVSPLFHEVMNAERIRRGEQPVEFNRGSMYPGMWSMFGNYSMDKGWIGPSRVSGSSGESSIPAPSPAPNGKFVPSEEVSQYLSPTVF